MLKRSKTDDEGGGSIPVEGAHVLVVDDDPDAAETVRRFFAHYGFEASVARKVEEAVDQVAQGSVDLVLIDFHQGGTSLGLKLLDLLRAHDDPGVSRVRAVMTTDLDENRMFSWQSGVDGFLIRPYHANDLMVAVTGALERTDAERVEHRQEQMRLAGDPRTRRAAGEPI